MELDQYIDIINKRYKLGNATEHTFRGDLQQLLESLVPDIRATNEPKRQSCGAPDYILTKKEIPVGFIEAKDIGDKDLEGAKKTGNKEQFDRYKASLNNLIFTDYLDFHLYIDGIFITKIAIATTPDPSKGGEIKALPENFATFTNLIKDFCSHVGQTIKSSKKLAEMMAGKARLLSDVIGKALTSDEEKHEDSTLKDQMNAFRQILIHDITAQGFADVYAQTIAYGMFAARLHDPTLPTFSRQEAAELIPKSNPFLRKLFGYIAGPDIDDRIKWIVDSLVDIFLACNVEEILKNYGKSTKMEDPIIHFYETFLSEYDPKLRKARGVWYTPAPVVNFIVRAVDDILKTEFDLPQGLADNSKTKIKVDVQGKKTEQEVHKVQILDPATGTGTFLAEIIKHIHKKFEGQQGIWSNYVETHLLPRLNGFELLMASYAMAHLKLDLLLTETGFKPTTNQRFRVYLTNSLEESHPDTGTLFANWLSTEANEANHIKRDSPVMCVIGNPPYNAMSKNQGEWIMKLMEDYKKEPGGKEKLKERNPKMINDDYVKFIRLSQYLIEKNGEGVLAFIHPHGYLNSDTFRGVRWNLLNTFTKIYSIDLHGNSKKNELGILGERDENVFDIMQGVSINIFIKKKGVSGLGEVFYKSLKGKRDDKYNFLLNNDLNKVIFEKIILKKPNYNFINTLNNDEHYKTLVSLNELFEFTSTGLQTDKDDFCIKLSKTEIKNVYNDVVNLECNSIRGNHNIGEDTSSWSLLNAISDLKKNIPSVENISKVQYRPFDIRFTYYTGNSNGFMGRPRNELIKHLNGKDNFSLVTIKNSRSNSDWNFSLISKLICTKPTTITSLDANYIFPLYLYPETKGQQTIGQTTERTPNLNPEIVKQIADKLGIAFVAEKYAPLNLPKGETSKPHQDLPKGETFGTGEVKLPGYQTANARSYRFTKEFQEELKKNPTDAEKIMWELVRNKKTGHKIRRQHIIDDFITDFVCLRKNLVIEIDGKIHLQQKEYDELRSARLNELGYEVIRFTNDEVFENAELVVSKIKQKLDSIEDITAYLHLPEGETSAHVNLPEEGTTGANTSLPLEGSGEVFAPIDILDYIYAVLHSPTYREKYKEFLKIDFPRVPYPKDKETFWQLVKLGGEIRQIHLLESPTVEKYITQYPIDGDNVVVKPKYENGKVYINDTQYFDNVPQVAWDFYIGGYQPAQKWLKDRKERKLEFDDILHYQKIIVALSETDRLMKEIDEVEME